MSGITPGLRSSAATLVVLALAVASPVGAELAFLTNGHVLRVSGYRAQGEMIELQFPNGGKLVIPLLQVERVIEDEIDRRPPPDWSAALSLDPGFHELESPLTVPYGGLIYEAARRHDLNPRLVAAVVRAESAFQAWAVSRAGARGLMQVMPATGKRFGAGPGELFDPATNLDTGGRYLRWLLTHFDGNVTLALAGYNAGEGSVERYDGVPPYRETRNYLMRIGNILEEWAVEPTVATGSGAR